MIPPTRLCTLLPHMANRLVGDPIDVVTGANIDATRDFELWGPLPLVSMRYYDSARHHKRLALGHGFGHDLFRALIMGVDGIVYRDGFGAEHPLGAPLVDGAEVVYSQWRLRRLDLRRYRLFEPGRPACDFEFINGMESPARLRRMSHGLAEITLNYNPAGALAIIIDSLGRRIDVQESPDGRLLGMTLEASTAAPARKLLTCDYDDRGNLTRAVDPYASECRFTWDANNRITRRTDRNGFAFLFEYDALGRCTRARGEDGVLDTRLVYEPDIGHTTVTHADGGVWQHFFDPESKTVFRIINPLGGFKEYTANERGHPVAEIDELGNAVMLTVDQQGVPIAKTLPDGRIIRLPADPRHFESPAHRVPVCPAEYEHGTLFAWREQTPPFTDAIAQLDLPRSVQAAIVGRDFKDRAPYERTLPEPPPPGTSSYPLPIFGRVFDDFGKLVRQVGAGGASRRWLYDRNGNITRFTDFDGHAEEFEYRSFNHCVRRTLPGGLAATIQWSDTDQISGFTDSGGTTTRLVHDQRNQLVEVHRAGALKEKYILDAAGNLVERQGPSGTPGLMIDIGPGNRAVRKRLASGGVHEYAYDDMGRYAAVSADGEKTEFAYDIYGRRCKDVRAGLGTVHTSLSQHKPGSTTVLGRFTTRYAHRLDGTVEIIDPVGGRHTTRHIGHGIVHRACANGTAEVSQYDPRGRCLRKSVYRVHEETAPWNRTFSYSGEGDLLSVEDSAAGLSKFTYDGSHRLTTARTPGGGVAPIAYDAGANLVLKPGLEDVVIGPANRLVSANGDSFDYNDRQHISVRRGRTSHTYTYDSRDRLIGIATERGTWKATYDALGRRTRVNDYGRETVYYWDSDRLSAEVRHDGRVRVYVYEYPLAMTPLLMVELDTLAAPLDTARVYTIFADHLGAPVRIEDAAGMPVWRADYEPYGVARVDPVSTIDFSFRYPGHWFDESTGLHYNRFRYYSPELGRYLQSDPAGLAGGDNLYAYPASPLSRVDLRGLDCPECTARRVAAEEADEREGNPRVAAIEDDEARANVARRVGMQDEDLARLQQQANEDGKLIVVRATNPNSLDHHDDPGSIPKPVTVKQKTDPETGLVNQRRNPGEEAPPGFHWGDDGNLRTNDTNQTVHGDHDLQGVYHYDEHGDQYHRQNSNDPEVQQRINEAFDGRDMVQHGANDDYRPGGEMGRQPGTDEHFVVIEPDGTSRVVGPPTSALQDYYQERGIPWPYDDFRTTPPTPRPAPAGFD